MWPEVGVGEGVWVAESKSTLVGGGIEINRKRVGVRGGGMRKVI